MANISFVNGTMRIKTETREDIGFLVDLIKRTHGRFNYDTYLIEAYDKKFNIEKNINFDGDNYYIEFNFDGDGRWVYSNNLEMFTVWIVNSSNKNVSENDLQRLQDIHFILECQYREEEPGCDVNQDVEIEVEHKKGKHLDDYMDILFEKHYEPNTLDI